MERLARIRDSLQRPAIVAALALVAIYALMRTFGVPETAVTAWAVLGALLTVAAPVAGLVLLAVLGPFTEAQTAQGAITPVPYVVAALGAGVLVHLVFWREIPRIGLALALALALFAGTGLGVAVSFLSHGAQIGLQSAQAWATGVGGGLVVLVGAAYVAWRGEIRPGVLVAGSVALAAALGVIDYVFRGSVTESPLGWLLRDHNEWRLTAIIPAPNAAAAIFLSGLAVGLAAAAFADRTSVRLTGTIVAGVAGSALLLTYSRSGLLAVGLVLAVLAWRWRRSAGIVAMAAVALASVAAVAGSLVREVPAAADEARIDAWVAALRMWAAQPLLGHGFGSFERLHGMYGSDLIDAPHNEWLRLFAEEGTVVGAIGIAFAVVIPITIIRGHGWLSAGAAASAAGFMLMAAFNNPFLYVQVNVPVFMLMGTGLGLALRERVLDRGERALRPAREDPRAGSPAVSHALRTETAFETGRHASD